MKKYKNGIRSGEMTMQEYAEMVMTYQSPEANLVRVGNFITEVQKIIDNRKADGFKTTNISGVGKFMDLNCPDKTEALELLHRKLAEMDVEGYEVFGEDEEGVMESVAIWWT